MNHDDAMLMRITRRDWLKQGTLLASAGLLGAATPPARVVAESLTPAAPDLPGHAFTPGSGGDQSFLLKPKKPLVQALGYQVTTHVPHGNACDVHVYRDEKGLLTVEFAADPQGDRATLWFCFRLQRLAGGLANNDSTLRLVLRHYDNMLASSDTSNLHPVVRDPGHDWRRLPAPDAHDLPDGRKHVSWITTMPGESLDVAASFPYGLQEFQQLLNVTSKHFQMDTIGVSQGGRPIVRLANDYGQPGGTRPGIYMIARQHAHETTGGWVLDGILRGIVAAGDAAPLVWAVPFAHIDGVIEGDFGKDSNPVDLNRAWAGRTDRHEIRVIRNDVLRWMKRCRAGLLLDSHSPTWSHGGGAFVFIANKHAHPENHQRCTFWTDAMAEKLGDYATSPFVAPESLAQRKQVADTDARTEAITATAYANMVLDIAGVTVETPYGSIRGRILEKENLLDIGKRIAAALVEQSQRLPPQG